MAPAAARVCRYRVRVDASCRVASPYFLDDRFSGLDMLMLCLRVQYPKVVWVRPLSFRRHMLRASTSPQQ